MLVTVFTPLYNREKSIRAVYESLCAQTNKCFEWLVINDGSTDRSASIMEDIIANHDRSFPIRYYKKENEGLNRTINKALDLASGEMLFRVDSDDFALPNAVEYIQKYYHLIEHDEKLCSIVFLPQDHLGHQVGYHPFDEVTKSNFLDYRYVYNATGDRAEVTKLSVFRKFRFPEYEGEKFCTEGIVWGRMAQEYDCWYIPERIYQKSFQEDTITSNIYNTLKKCANGTSQHYYELLKYKRIPFKSRVVIGIKYFRYAFFAKRMVFKGVPLPITAISFPLSCLVMIHDYLKYRS